MPGGPITRRHGANAKNQSSLQCVVASISIHSHTNKVRFKLPFRNIIFIQKTRFVHQLVFFPIFVMSTRNRWIKNHQFNLFAPTQKNISYKKCYGTMLWQWSKANHSLLLWFIICQVTMEKKRNTRLCCRHKVWKKSISSSRRLLLHMWLMYVFMTNFHRILIPLFHHTIMLLWQKEWP